MMSYAYLIAEIYFKVKIRKYIMEIKEYENNPYHLAQLVDLINYCQNIEAKLDIKMAEQDDIFQIENYYQ
ncbi:GNAT family acetyltransferase, partial [Streptococcus agalactiae]